MLQYILCLSLLFSLHTSLLAQDKEFWGSQAIKAEGTYNSAGLKTGTWKYYYENGQLEAQGAYTGSATEENIEIVKNSPRYSAIEDAGTARTGLWRFYYRNGQLKGEGKYNNACPQGLVQRWHNNGVKAEEAEYEQCKALGNRKLWDRNGKLYFEHKLLNDGKSLEIEWYAGGQKKSEIPYKNGQQYGRVKRWYPNGKKEEEIMMKNTRVHGAYRSWYENGNKQREFFSISNVMSGEYREWNEQGKLLTEIIEQPNESMVLVRNYWDNGKLKLEGRSKLTSSLSIHRWAEKRHGRWIYYAPSGDIIKTDNYADGKLLSTELP